MQLQSVFQEHRVSEKFQRQYAEWRKHPPTVDGVPLGTFLKVASEMGVEQPNKVLCALITQRHAVRVCENTQQYIKIQ